MGDKKDQVVVRRVKPYPFPVSLSQPNGEEMIFGQVKRLVTQGFLADMVVTYVRAGQTFHCVFQIPVLKFDVRSKVRTIKTYDQGQRDAASNERILLVEFQFVESDIQRRKKITEFIQRIGQASSGLQ